MANLSNIWKINGTAIYAPNPNTVIEIGSITKEMMTDDGVTHIDWIRASKKKVLLKYGVLTSVELSTILNLINGKEYTLTYLDPLEGAKTINCFSRGSVQEFFTGAYMGGVWQNVTIECNEK